MNELKVAQAIAEVRPQIPDRPNFKLRINTWENVAGIVSIYAKDRDKFLKIVLGECRCIDSEGIKLTQNSLAMDVHEYCLRPYKKATLW